MGCLDYTMTQTKNEVWMGQFTPEMLEWFYGLPSWVVACWAIGVWGGLVGCILLLLRKRVAGWVLLASFVAATLTTIQNYGLSNGMEIMGTFGAVFAAVILVIALGLVLYAGWMAKRKVLT